MLKEIQMQVSEEIAVKVLPHFEHEFLMTTKEVAFGYGTTVYAIRKTLFRNPNDFIEGKHYEIAGTNCPRELKLPHNAVLWTKRGIVRLGFFIKSKQAILFRDWAEELILNKLEQREDLILYPVKSLPQKRNHNRLTQDRMISILSDVAKIDDKALRLSLIEKLGV